MLPPVVVAAALYVLGQFRGAGMREDADLLARSLAAAEVGELSAAQRIVLEQGERIGAGGLAPPEDAFWKVRAALDDLGLSPPLVMGTAKSLIAGFARGASAGRVLH